jgi:uncharacterized surface protein with fasciclin (FAS1) repeats
MKRTFMLLIALCALASGAGAVAAQECQSSSHHRTTRASGAARVVRTHFNSEADIVDTAVAAGDFMTLVAAVKAAGLVETLRGDGPFTVFAPTDAAFAKIPKATLQSLLQPENREQLSKILTYHVVLGRVTARQVKSMRGAKTVQGGRVHFASTHDGVRVNNANIVKTDVATSNGIIHVIDTVLMPK